MRADAQRPGARNLKAGTRDKILDAAEIEFSIHGYEACSLRMISEAHDINLGLVHYYFGSKDALLSEVFLRRSKLLVGRRNALLGEARRRYGDEPIPVKEIARCFITPSADMIKEGEGPRAYIRLQGILRSDPSEFSKKLRGKALNATNKKFIRELQRSCPHLTPASVVWRFSAMVGAFYSLISKSARVDQLSNGLCDPDDLDAALAEAIPFIAGGFHAATGARRKPSSRATRSRKKD
jgi:AcrR family transcriptional regulator